MSDFPIGQVLAVIRLVVDPVHGFRKGDRLPLLTVGAVESNPAILPSAGLLSWRISLPIQTHNPKADPSVMNAPIVSRCAHLPSRPRQQ